MWVRWPKNGGSGWPKRLASAQLQSFGVAAPPPAAPPTSGALTLLDGTPITLLDGTPVT